MPSLQGNSSEFSLPSINLTSVVLPSQDRPLGKLAKGVSPLWPLQKATLLLMPLPQLPPTGDTLPCVWNREVSQKSDPTIPHVQQWWIQTVQNSPNQLFGSILCSQSLLFHFGGTTVLLGFLFFPTDYGEIALTCYWLYWSVLEAHQRGISNIQKGSSKSWIRNPHLHSTCYLSGPL